MRSSASKLAGLVMVLSACHLGLANAILMLAKCMDDWQLVPYPLASRSQFLVDTLEWQTRACWWALKLLSFPLLVGPKKTSDWLEALVVFANTGIWGLALALCCRAWNGVLRRARGIGDAPIAGVSANAAPTPRQSICRTISLTVTFAAIVLLLGPIRLQYGYRIVTALGLNPGWFMQYHSSGWEIGGVVELVLSLLYFLMPPIWAVLVWQSSAVRSMVIALIWFASIVWLMIAC